MWDLGGSLISHSQLFWFMWSILSRFSFSHFLPLQLATFHWNFLFIFVYCSCFLLLWTNKQSYKHLFHKLSKQTLPLQVVYKPWLKLSFMSLLIYVDHLTRGRKFALAWNRRWLIFTTSQDLSLPPPVGRPFDLQLVDWWQLVVGTHRFAQLLQMLFVLWSH